MFDHVGLAVRDTGKALEFYRNKLGMEVVHQEEFGGMLVTFLDDGMFELLEPLEEGAVMDYLESRGEGVQHVAVEVDDLDIEVERLEGEGVRFVVGPERGAWGKRVAFVHPGDAFGVLLELCEYP